MTQDDVIRITRSFGICELTSKPKQSIHYSLTINEMLNVFKLVAEHEREACAKVCESDGWVTGFACADAIRARGQA